MRLNIDIIEDDLLGLGGNILQTLLVDHTTGRNIIWATHDYEKRGAGYRFGDVIRVEAITGENNHIIMPRISKALQQQRSRSQVMAEVFTPSWVCNAQNNLIDDAWFGRAAFSIRKTTTILGRPTTSLKFQRKSYGRITSRIRAWRWLVVRLLILSAAMMRLQELPLLSVTG